MAYYRLYSIKSGHLSACRDFHARGDGEALDTAGGYAGRETMELWCGGRLVQTFEALQAAQRR